jgi:hypothetical protein
LSAEKGNKNNEGPCVSKKDLREVQGHYPPRCGACDLRERKAQAAPRLSLPWHTPKPPKAVNSEQLAVNSKNRSNEQQ